MRRLLAIAMVFLFGCPLAVPLFAPGDANTLPVCCRRDGRHHCASGMLADSGTRAVSTIAPKCPNWPKSTPAPWPKNFAPTQTGAIDAPLYSRPESAPQTEARYRVAFARSRQKRGPPAILL
jgi:hypothetical protein